MWRQPCGQSLFDTHTLFFQYRYVPRDRNAMQPKNKVEIGRTNRTGEDRKGGGGVEETLPAIK